MTENTRGILHKVASRWLRHLECRRVKGSDSAQALRLSLPIPRGMKGHFGFAGIPTQNEPVGFWSAGDAPGPPRRVLLLAAGNAPERVGVRRAQPPPSRVSGPTAELAVVEQRYDIALAYEINEVILRMEDRGLGVRIGLLTDEGVHWWQWVRLETLSEGPICRTVRAMGAVPVHFESEKDIPNPPDMYRYPWLHRHNHVRGELFARCFSNGVVELYLRHINGAFFTEGGDLKGVVPVIGFRPGAWRGDLRVCEVSQLRNSEISPAGNTPAEPGIVTGRQRWQLGTVTLDTDDAAHLLSEKRPGRICIHDGLLLYQPYEGVEAYAGTFCRVRTGNAYLARAAERKLPKGVARTVRMVASLGDAPPEVAVYVAPEWWYGACEEFAAEPLLPVHDECDETLRSAEEWLNHNLYTDCFDDGAQCRGGLRNPDGSPGEPGWEGEVTYAHLVAAYRSGNPLTYDLAIRSSYYLADVATEHAFMAVRMHAYETGAQSLPMQRILGHVGAYLETGDPYLLETAKALADHAYWWDRTYYPRRSIGRDAAYIRGLVFLYRFTGEGFYLRRAKEAIRRVIATQLADGSYNDQGGTTGIHGALNLVVKPWMGCIATEPMVDYLDVCFDEEIAEGVIRFADWLLSARVSRDGKVGWPYQWGFGGQKVYPNVYGEPWPLPTSPGWHTEYVAKILGWAALHTGKREYYRVWYDSWSRYGRRTGGDHGCTKALLNLTWQRMKLWGARLGADAIELAPRRDLLDPSAKATISTPHGAKDVALNTQSCL